MYWIPVIITLVVTLTFGSYRFRATGNNFYSAWLSATVLNILLMGIGAYWWFFYGGVGDGLAQGIGVVMYGIFTFLIGIVYTIVFTRMRNRAKVER